MHDYAVMPMYDLTGLKHTRFPFPWVKRDLELTKEILMHVSGIV
jgi:hypothetical protein